MTTTKFPGWLSLMDAAQKFKVRYETLRRLARSGVFTVGKFSNAAQRPPVFLKVAELKAWKEGGVEAVEKVREAGAAASGAEYGEAGA